MKLLSSRVVEVERCDAKGNSHEWVCDAASITRIVDTLHDAENPLIKAALDMAVRCRLCGLVEARQYELP